MRSFIRIVELVALLALTGCAGQNKVLFVTKTSFGLDVDSTPAAATFAYDRTEAFVGPTDQDGKVPPVVSKFETNGKLFDRAIRQVYATGQAARTVVKDSTLAGPTDTFGPNTRTLYFGTGTTMGVKIGFPTGNTPEFSLGYKRKEISLIPVGPNGFPSVLGTFDTSVEASGPTTTKLGITQYFATGRAANQLATRSDLQQAFADDARSALVQYGDDLRDQSALALETLACFARVDDAKLAPVWDNANRLGLLDAEVAPQLQRAATRDARILYTRNLAVLDGRSSRVTGLMRGHRVFVCDLAGK